MLNNQQNVLKAIIKGHKTIGKIAKHTGFHRQSVRVIIDKLKQEDLITEQKNNGNLSYKINELSDIKTKKLNELEKLKSDIPRLKAFYNETKDTQVINFLEGKKGLQSVLLDEVLKGKEICSFHLCRIKKEFEEEYVKNTKRRTEKKIFMKILSQFDNKTPYSKTKKLNWKSKTNIFSYANKTTIIFENDKIWTIKIPEIVKYFQELFDEKWKNRG